MAAIHWFVANSVRLLFLLALLVVGFAFSVGLSTGASVPRTLIVVLDLITGGSPAARPELAASWIIGYGWLVRLIGWLFIPIVVAVLFQEAQEGRTRNEELLREMLHLEWLKDPNAEASEIEKRARRGLEAARAFYKGRRGKRFRFEVVRRFFNNLRRKVS